jgi:hypothetical protein
MTPLSPKVSPHTTLYTDQNQDKSSGGMQLSTPQTLFLNFTAGRKDNKGCYCCIIDYHQLKSSRVLCFLTPLICTHVDIPESFFVSCDFDIFEAPRPIALHNIPQFGLSEAHRLDSGCVFLAGPLQKCGPSQSIMLGVWYTALFLELLTSITGKDGVCYVSLV